jgi:hypothetical protein
LGFTLNCIVETILVTMNSSRELNAAPMGIKRIDEDLLEVAPFLSSRSYINLREHLKATINITQSPLLFFETAFKDEVSNQPKINEEMIIEYADATILVDVLDEPNMTDLRAYFTLKPKNIRILRKLPAVFSRGKYASIEAVIHATRVKTFISEGMLDKAEQKEEEFKASAETVRRVSSEDSEEAQVIDHLKKLIKQWKVK